MVVLKKMNRIPFPLPVVFPLPSSVMSKSLKTTSLRGQKSERTYHDHFTILRMANHYPTLALFEGGFSSSNSDGEGRCGWYNFLSHVTELARRRVTLGRLTVMMIIIISLCVVRYGSGKQHTISLPAPCNCWPHHAAPYVCGSFIPHLGQFVGV